MEIVDLENSFSLSRYTMHWTNGVYEEALAFVDMVLSEMLMFTDFITFL